MLSFTRAFRSQSRSFSSTAYNATKVAVLGANGGIGQPLSLLLKLNQDVSDLSLYDLRGAPGVAADVSHINTRSTVAGFTPENGGIEAALKGAEIVVVPAGMPRKPGMSRDDLFATNASIVRDLAKAIADYSPKALVCIISNPVNSTVPIVAEVFKSKGVYDPKRLFGVTTLDVVRSSRFISQVQKTDPKDEEVTVIGGHSGVTIVPLISQSNHAGIAGTELDELVHRIQFGGDEVVQAKDGAGSATLSMAYAGARFAGSLLKALNGAKNISEPTFVESPLFKDEGIDFFSSRVTLGPNGVEEIHALGKTNEYENKLIEACKVDLKKNIAKGVEFFASNP